MSRWTRLGCMLLLLGLACPPAPARPAPPGTAPADTLSPPPVLLRAWQTGTRPDRLEHAGLAFTIGLGTGLATRRPEAAAGSACALGVLKEIHDRRHGGFDAVDLATGFLGGALAAVVTHAVTR